jgi:hypothetical protein
MRDFSSVRLATLSMTYLNRRLRETILLLMPGYPLHNTTPQIELPILDPELTILRAMLVKVVGRRRRNW